MLHADIRRNPDANNDNDKRRAIFPEVTVSPECIKPDRKNVGTTRI
jgi:hypothetical protein